MPAQPKRASRAVQRARAARQEADTAPQPVATSALDLVAQEEAAPRGRPRRSRQRNLDEQVHKCLKDNFPTFGAQQVDHVLVDGRTLRQTLKRDKELKQLGEPSAPEMGKRYYEALRDRFSLVGSPLKRLKVGNMDEPLDPDLERGLMGLTGHQKKYDVVMDFLEKGAVVNQLSTVCLYKHALKVSPHSGTDACNFLIAVLKYVSRVALHTTFAHGWDAVKSHLDDALCRSWKSFKSSGLSAQCWWDGVRLGAKLVLPEEETVRCLALPVDGEWESVEQHVATIVQSSEIGKCLFGAAFSKMMRGKLSSTIARKVESLTAADITEQTVRLNMQQFLDELKASGKDAMEAGPTREIVVRYRGCVVPIKVSSPYDEYMMSTMATIYGNAVDTGSLPQLLAENQLLPSGRVPSGTKVEDSVVSAAKSARAAAEELLKNKTKSGAMITETLEGNAAVLLQLDRHFRLMIAFFKSVSGDGAERRLKEEMPRCLPGPDAEFGIAESLRKLDTLGQSKLFEFCGVGLQSTFRSVVSVVQAVNVGSAPSYDNARMSHFMRDIMAKVSNFCQHSEPDGSSGAGVKFVGAEAAQKKYDNLKSLVAAGEQVSLGSINEVVPFTWLLPGGCGGEIKKWVAAAVKADMVASAAASVAAPKGSAKGPGRKPVSRDARALVMSVLQD